MNRTHRTVWSRLLGAWVAVSEQTRGAGKGGRSSSLLLAGAVLLAGGLLGAPRAGAQLPTGGQVTAGSAAITQTSPSQVTIQQASQRAAINWSSFSIGAGKTVQFNQPSAAAVALNRVTGPDPSAIQGALRANGQVFLINPNGVLFSPTAQVNVGALVASTRNLTDAAFMSPRVDPATGRVSYAFSGDSAAGVINQGSITAQPGGFVALVGARVDNEAGATIRAPGGSVALGTGRSVLLDVDAAGAVSLRLDPVLVDGLLASGAATRDASGSLVLNAQGAQAVGAGVINQAGHVDATTLQADAQGRVMLFAPGGLVLHSGTTEANGPRGGSLQVRADTLVDGGQWQARGTQGSGGTVDIALARHAEQIASAGMDAGGATAGGSVRVTAGESLWLSGRLAADGSQGAGGSVAVTAPRLTLAGGTLSADGATGGGTVRAGGGWQGGDADLANAQRTVVGAGSRLSASATADGNGGTVVVWSQERTQAGDSISARGAGSGNGGRVEVSSHGELAFGASVDVGAPQGQAGTLLLDPTNIVIGDTAGTVSGNFALIDPSPAAGNDFGSGGVLELADRKFVVNSPNYDWGALLTDAGAVRLYSESGAMLSVLAGSRAGERVGSGGVYAVGTGLQNFVVSSPMWSNGAATNAGAVTWFQKGTEALQTISTANSLVGTHANDQVGQAVTVLSDGNYAVASPNWGNGNDLAVGAVTFRFGDLTARGIVSGDNSLVGTRAYDAIGKGGVTALRNGAYVVVSPDWAYNTTAKGAFTWVMPTTDIDGTPVGAIGTVSADNSLVSDKANGPSGFTAPSVTVLPDGNYVMTHSGFNNARGAVTWGSANAGVTGLMSLRANVVGNADGDQAGSGGVTGLANGNFVILSPMFNGEKGAATWASGEPVTQTHQQAQVGPYALTGNVKGDFADSSIVALSNGNYAVVLPMWDHMYYDPLLQPTPIVDRIDSGMAVVYKGVDGKNAVQTGRYDYTVSDHYDEFGIMGQSSYDRIGSGGIIPMVLPTDVTKATFAILSPHFDSDKGAISMVSAYNSRFMLGSTSNFTLTSAVSVVGANTGDMVGSGGGVALANGNALVASPNWSNTAAGTAYPNGSREGALTEVVGVYGQTNAGKIKSAGAIVGASNSLTGATAGDQIGSGGIFQLPDGQYLLNSPLWADADGSRVGAVSKLGDGTSLSGLLSPAESVTIAGSMEAGRTRGSVLTSARSLADQADDDKFLLQTINSADFGRQITIIDLTPVVGSSDPYSLLYSNATGTATLSRTNIANWLKGGTAVLLQASNDITVNGAIDTTGASGTLGKLTLQAGRSINLNADITTGGDVDFTANDTAAHGVIATLRSTGTDAASRLGGITMASGTTLTARNVALRVLDGVASDTAGAITLANVQAVSLKLYHAGLSPAGVTFSVGTKVYDQTTAAPTGQEQFDLTTKLAGVLSILGGSNLGTPVVRGYEFASADATSTPTFLANQALALTGFSNPFGLFNASGKALFLNGTGQITPRPVDLAGTKAYDATAVFNPATAGQLTASGLLAGDTVTLGGTLSVNNTRVNTYGYADLVNAGTLTLGTPNYALLAGSTVTLDITPRPISLAGSKTYDGSARFDASLLTVGSVLAGDVVRVSGSLVTDSANRGTYGATDVDATGLAISNANYRFTSASSATLTIKPRTLTFSGFKGFDGGPVFAAGNLVASNLLPGDTSGLSGSVTLASATPGLYGPEAVQAMTLTATNPNYQVGSTSAVSLVIAPPNPGEQAALAPGGGLVSTAATSLPLAVRGGGISLPAGVTAP